MKLSKRFILFSLIGIFSSYFSVSYASDHLQDGPYIGAAIGLDIPIYHEITALQNDVFQTTQIRDHVAYGTTSNLFMGYGKYFNNFYLGGELVGSLFTGTDSSYANQTQGGVNVMSSYKRKLT